MGLRAQILSSLITDINISIVAGWNLVSHSSEVNLSIEDLTFTNSSGTEFTWSSGITNNMFQAYLAYYDSSSATASERKYKYVATSDLSMDDTHLRKDKGYWLWANQSGNLTLPSVGGSWSNETYLWNKLRFRNGSEELRISDAGTAGWLVTDLQYWGEDIFGEWKFRVIPTHNPTLSPWQGYFIYSNYDNITLIRQN